MSPSAPDDTGIREKILEQFKSEKWAPVATVDAIVRDGVVTLTGYVLDERQRGALKVLVENVPGVKAVRDHLAWIDTTTGMLFESPGDAGAPQRSS